MSYQHYPVLLWKDSAGFTTAALIDPDRDTCGLPPMVAYSDSSKTALAEVREALQWRQRQFPWFEPSVIRDSQLIFVKVEVRPEYRFEEKVFPCPRTFTLRVEVVDTEHEHGVRFAAVPRLSVEFYYTQGDLSDLVRHYARERMSGLSPHQLARFEPVTEVQLESLSVRLPREGKQQRQLELPQLSAVAEPMGSKALRALYNRPYGREAEVEELALRLQGPGCVLLVGEQGSGKTSLLLEAARKLEKTSDPDKTKDPRRHWVTRGARLIAGMRYLGEWEERTEQVIAELSEVDGVLCVEGLQELIQSGGHTPESGVAAFLTPYIERGDLRLVAEATPTELDACRRLLPGFVDLFSILSLRALSNEEALRVLGRVKELWDSRYRLEVDERVIAECHRLHQRFLPYHAFPGRCSRFLGQLYEHASRSAVKIDRGLVVERFSAETGLPSRFLQDDVPLPSEEVLEFFSHRVVGQLQACRSVTHLVSRFKAGLNDPEKPLGVLFFCGPTGVGKTEMAKALAEMFFGAAVGEESRLVRLDMSEYGGDSAALRLLGTHARPGELIRKVREQAFSVILLDEFEKAHPDVFDLLMGVCDEGRLTDLWGRVTTFRSSVIVMTSNLGVSSLAPIGFKQERTPSFVAEVMNYFRPEFFNRIDEVVSFDPLSPETIRTIAHYQLASAARRDVLERRQLRLRWSEAVVTYLCERGYDARYGARPLKRLFDEQVMAPLARLLVEHPDLRDVAIDLECDGDQILVG